jgi:serine/threonine protein kinase
VTQDVAREAVESPSAAGVPAGRRFRDLKPVGIPRDGTHVFIATMDCGPSGATVQVAAKVRRFIRGPETDDDREVYFLRRLPRHPRILRLRESWFDELRQVVVIVLDDGIMTLADWLEVGRIGEVPAGEIIRIMIELVEGAEVLERCGVIHGDLKMCNVMFQGGHVKLSDFDSAVTFGEGRPPPGTWHLAAPEIVLGELATSQSDVYSLGLMALGLMAGRELLPLTPGDPWSDTMGVNAAKRRIRSYARMSAPRPRRRALYGARRGRAPAATDEVRLRNLWSLIMDMVQPDPRRRPRIAEVMSELREIDMM